MVIKSLVCATPFFIKISLFLLLSIIRVEYSNGQIMELLEKADSLLGENQDSLAWKIIETINTNTQEEGLWKSKLEGDYYAFAKDQYGKAIQSYMILIKTDFDTTNKELTLKVAKGINDMGIVYFRMTQFDSALWAHKLSLMLYELHNDEQGLAFNYNNMAVVFDQQRKVDSAILYYGKSLQSAMIIRDTLGIGFNHLNMGVVYQNKGEIIPALDHYHRSLNIFKNAGQKRFIYAVKRKLSEFYLKISDYNSALPFLYDLKFHHERSNKKFH